jgi:hypothetical protein
VAQGRATSPPMIGARTSSTRTRVAPPIPASSITEISIDKTKADRLDAAPLSGVHQLFPRRLGPRATHERLGVDPPDADQLAGCVGWLLRDSNERAQARTAGPELIRERFGLQRMIEETVQAHDLYRPAICGSRHGDSDLNSPEFGGSSHRGERWYNS